MATSPLTAALMGSQNADPTAMMLNPQMQLAQGLLQQGTDASPIRSPWQGLARLAQVMAGRHIENKAMQGASSMYGKAAEDAAKTVPEGSAIYKALTSDNPLIKMQALNVFNKSILQFSEPKDLSPGSQSIVPGVAAPVGQNTNPMTPEGQRAADAAANPNMAAGNANVLGAATKAETDAHNQSDLNYKPAIAGQTAVAENPALIARAGGVAGAEAPWKTEQTRSGAIIPLTSIPGIGQRVPGQGAMPPLPPAKPPVLQPQMPPPGVPRPPLKPPHPALRINSGVAYARCRVARVSWPQAKKYSSL